MVLLSWFVAKPPVSGNRDENEETDHFTPIIAQTMEVDFAGKTFEMTDRLTGEVSVIVVFVAVLPYSQMIYVKE